MMSLYQFRAVTAGSAPAPAIQAAETIIQAVLFLQNAVPFYFGNHVMAKSAAESFTADALTGFKTDADPAMRIAHDVIEIFRGYERTGDYATAGLMYKQAQDLQKHGYLKGWKPFALRMYAGPSLKTA